MKKNLILLGIVIILIGSSYFIWHQAQSKIGVDHPATSLETTKDGQSISKHQWPQFHGTYLHTGYADIEGPEKAILKWKFNLGKITGTKPNSVIIASDGTIYVAGAGKIFALDKNGTEIWEKSYQNTQGPALAEDGTIYFLSGKAIIALDKDGKEKWQFKTNGNTIIAPTVGPDGTIYQGSWDGYFYAINKDGTLKWKYKTAGAISYPASIDQNGIIYLGGGDAHAGPDGNLYAFNPDGSLKWKYDTKAMRVGSPAIGSDGLIYVPAAPALLAFDSLGNLKWSKGPATNFNNIPTSDLDGCGAPPLPACGGMGQPQNGNMNENMPQPPMGQDDIAGIITPAIYADETIYVGNAQGILSAIDLKTQKIKWTYETDANPNQAGFYGLPNFPLVDKDGTIYFGSIDNNMYAVNKKGKLLWKYQTGGKITEASPAFDNSGTLYFTSEDGYLYAIGE
ncbi:MAG TPA: PQQ-binding-like beta-propeller repeat protein [Candidatus Bipolaricaulota bacterium]|nr:PQQ-binding-like beta-propeller repeat protein [Candidatus Bipolaricaulota bacterium]